MRKLLVLLMFILEGALAVTSPTVVTPLGIIEGTTYQTYTGRSIYKFAGIPYAEPPVGFLRFENPIIPKKWEGTLKANQSVSCLQFNQYRKNPDGSFVVTGQEDCLYYTVYTPTLDKNASLDVLVHIHGGAFMFGSGTSTSAYILGNRNVVFVNLNYRLGPLGFLSTQDEVLPGNLGLRDQQLALKQIKKNIEYFGGNPNSITLTGLSAGGASVQLHYLLPESCGLFHKGFAQSGTALNNWVLMEKPLEKTKRLASLVGCSTYCSKSIKKCLKNKPAKLIVEKVKYFQSFLYNPFSPWSIVVDGLWSKNPILSAHPLKLLIDKKICDVPLIMSYVTSEGLYPGADFYPKDEYFVEIDTQWNNILPSILMYNYTVKPSLRNNLSQAIRKEYLKNKTYTRDTYSEFIEALSDRNFLYDLDKGMKLHSAGMVSPVYSYEFNYRGNDSMSVKSTVVNVDVGVSHGDDTCYMLYIPGVYIVNTPDDIAMSELMIDLVTSFMDSGKPNITSLWTPLSKNVQDPLNVLRINKYNDVEIIHPQTIGRRSFWESLPIIENEKLLGIDLDF